MARLTNFGCSTGSSHWRGRKGDDRSLRLGRCLHRRDSIEDVDECPIETILGFSIGSFKGDLMSKCPRPFYLSKQLLENACMTHWRSIKVFLQAQSLCPINYTWRVPHCYEVHQKQLSVFLRVSPALNDASLSRSNFCPEHFLRALQDPR